MTFEAESRLARDNMPEYQQTIGMEKARHTLMFFLPEHRAEAAAAIEEEAAGLEDN